MKKLFTLMLGLVCCASLAMAETVLFSFDGSAVKDITTASVGTVALTGSNNAITNQKGNSVLKCAKTISDADNFVITPTQALAGGETITLGNFISSSKTQQGQIAIKYYDAEGNLLATQTGTVINNGDANDLQSNAAPTDEVLTVPAAAATAATIKIGRNSGLSGATTLYVSKFIITKADTKPESDLAIVDGKETINLSADAAETYTLTEDVDYTTTSTGAITFSSDDENVATVNATTGVITAVAPGTTTITLSQAEGTNHAAKEVEFTVNCTSTNVELYFHYVEDFNGSNDPYSCVNGSWSSAAMSSTTIDGVKWYTVTTSNVADFTVSISANYAETQTLNVAAGASGEKYYIVYASSNAGKLVVEPVSDPTMHSAEIFFLEPQGWSEPLSGFKMWVTDLNPAANTYGTIYDYDCTSYVTYAGQKWYKASVHYFGDTYKVYAKFVQDGSVNWENATVIESNKEKLYIQFGDWAADIDATHKSYNATQKESVLYKEGDAVALADVDGDIKWDWTKAGSLVQLKETTWPSKTDFVVLANLNGITNDETFNSSAIAATSEYPVRDGGYLQGGNIKFHTTVPGYVSVEFSNTGNRTLAADARWLYVNGVKTAFSSLKSNTKEKALNIFVPAGDVELTAYIDGNENPQYLRYYSVEFVTETSVTIAEGGLATYSSACAFSVTGATAYKAALVGAQLELTAIEGNVPAGVGVILKAQAGDVVTITPEASADAVEDNVLLPTTTATVACATKPAEGITYVLDATAGVFKKYTGAAFAANKAYLHADAEISSVLPVIAVHDVVTSVEDVEAAGEVMKTIEKGQLIIIKDGVRYNVMGVRF